MFVEAQCFRGEGRRGELMVGGLWRGETKAEEGGESGPLWQGAIRHPLTQAHSLSHVYTHTHTHTHTQR